VDWTGASWQSRVSPLGINQGLKFRDIAFKSFGAELSTIKRRQLNWGLQLAIDRSRADSGKRSGGTGCEFPRPIGSVRRHDRGGSRCGKNKRFPKSVQNSPTLEKKKKT